MSKSFTAVELKKWHDGPRNVNPKTGRKIAVGGPIHKALSAQYRAKVGSSSPAKAPSSASKPTKSPRSSRSANSLSALPAGLRQKVLDHVKVHGVLYDPRKQAYYLAVMLSDDHIYVPAKDANKLSDAIQKVADPAYFQSAADSKAFAEERRAEMLARHSSSSLKIRGG